MRVVNGVLAALLVLLSALQYNDPDPFVWGLIYLLGALWPAIAALAPRKYRERPPVRIGAWLSTAFFTLGFLWLAPTVGHDWIHVEEARESLGFLICATATFVALWTAARVNRGTHAVT